MPRPFAGLLGLRVEETDAQRPDVVNPVRFGAVEHDARHVFEVVVPEPSTEVLGTYGADFYAGTPAVTRAARGGGSAWYVATLLDDPGVAAVVRAVLDEHGLAGPLADVPDVEVAERVTEEGVRHLFLLNHSGSRVVVPCPADGVDLLGGAARAAGDEVVLDPAAVVLLRCQ
ncbi:beta-galactosidase trimerization domain-containing protein [Umezawaea sp.]|uniref:beta-galactosidase trimerization domain-containing protein n=1 Tax=Umezawaea sp. TaxID=1955258 RepID=UPI002ED4FFAC